MSDQSGSNLITSIKIENPINAEQQIIELCKKNPDGVNDVILQTELPLVTAQQRLAALNRLLSLGKLDLLKSPQMGILYRLKDKLDQKSVIANSSDLDEKLVYTIIKESGNKGIWIREISMKTNVKSTALNKTLKNLETKKLIKSVNSVNASKKKVYMLFDIEPDRSITGGAWYSGKEFESEFVEILNEQCYHYLCEKKEAAKKKYQSDNKFVNDPILQKNSSFITSKEIRDYIKNLGISKVDLNIEDIETILNTLVYDGKVERSIMSASASFSSTEQVNLYRATDPVLPNTQGSGLVRLPCGICNLIDNCHEDAPINPKTCVYMRDWLDF